MEGVFEVVKGLQSKWRDLGYDLLDPLGSVKVDTVQDQHESNDEACLKAVIEAFLRGEGGYQPSWRSLIHVLYNARETSIAQDIISYAEPVEGIKESA